MIHRTKTEDLHSPLLEVSQKIIKRYEKSQNLGTVFLIKSNQETNEI